MSRRILFCCALLLAFSLRPVWAQDSEEPSADETKDSTPSPAEPPVDKALKEEVKKTFSDIAPGDMETGVLKVSIEGTVSLNYVFAESPENFIITYNFKLEDFVRNKVDVLKGDAEITADVKGYLAKWPTGACTLNVSIGKIPYEIIFNRIKEDEARVDLKFKESILEKWESKCTFVDAPGAEFKTTGTPEKWLDEALKKTTPSLRRLILKMPQGSPTAVDFKIETTMIPDTPLGSSEIKGSGKVALSPGS